MFTTSSSLLRIQFHRVKQVRVTCPGMYTIHDLVTLIGDRPFGSDFRNRKWTGAENYITPSRNIERE